MSRTFLATLIFAAGLGHLGVLVAAAVVPFQLNWRVALASLPRLHRQMHWVYAGYVVLSIAAFAALSVVHANELASGSPLARAVSAYMAIFWGIRLILQRVFDVNDHLRVWWLRAGYLLLGTLFAGFTAVYAVAALDLVN